MLGLNYRETSVVVHDDGLILQSREIASYLLLDGSWKISFGSGPKLLGRKLETFLENLSRVHGGKAERPSCPHQRGVNLRKRIPDDLRCLCERKGPLLNQIQ